MITEKQIEEVKKRLFMCENPIFLFDDDPDGLSSFLLLYRLINKGHGIVVKNQPVVTKDIYANKVERYNPDLIVILDKPMVEEEFIDNFDCPIIWIDHHGLQKPSKKVCYINPLQNSESTPTTFQCWKIVEKERPQDIWLAMVGIVGDWYYPKELIKICNEKYSHLVDEKSKSAPELMFKSKSNLGILIKVFHFNLKGKIKEVEKNFKILSRVQEPNEILMKTTPGGKLIMKNYEKIKIEYEKIKQNVLDLKTDSFFLIAIISQDKYSFSSEMSNEIFYMNPDKLVIVGRSSSGFTKGSIRTNEKISLPEIINECLIGLEGYGGGHPQAAGFKIKDEDFEIFVEKFKEIVSKKLNNKN